MGNEVKDVPCEFCGTVVQKRYMDYDHHKGWHTTGRKSIYPFQERTYNFPEGKRSGVVVCQDCADKPSITWIHKLRIETVDNELEKAGKIVASIEKQIDRLERELKDMSVVISNLHIYKHGLSTEEGAEPEWNEVKIPATLRRLW